MPSSLNVTDHMHFHVGNTLPENEMEWPNPVHYFVSLFNLIIPPNLLLHHP